MVDNALYISASLITVNAGLLKNKVKNLQIEVELKKEIEKSLKPSRPLIKCIAEKNRT